MAPTTPTTPTTPPAATSAVVSGKVSDTAGAPVEGFVVTAGGQSATTGADGSYSLSLASPATSTVLLAAKSGYQTMAKQVGLLAGVTTTQNITAYPEGVRTTFAATSGKIVIVNGAVIDIPANAIKDAAGNPYTGVVTISASYNNPTTAAGNDAFPQPYAGLDGGNEVTLQSLGVIEAKLFAADGSPLQLSQPAKLVYPGVDSISTAATIPLWYYDEAKMTWVREGTATRDARDGSYSGTVTHFTQWNLDVPFGTGYASASITACINWAENRSYHYGITATLKGPGFSRTYYQELFSGSTLDMIRVPVASGMTLSFYDAATSQTTTSAPFTTADGAITTLPCVALVGSANPMPPPPPAPPPTPTAVNAPPSTYDGQNFSLQTYFDQSTPGYRGFESSYPIEIRIANNGQITLADVGSGNLAFFYVGTLEQAFARTMTGQMVVGGYFTMTGLPESLNPFKSQMELTGRIPDPQTGPVGTWRYTNPALNTVSPGLQPINPTFRAAV